MNKIDGINVVSVHTFDGILKSTCETNDLTTENKIWKCYKDGKLFYEGTIQNNKYHGYGKMYSDGKIFIEGTFVNGVCTGTAKIYNDDGYCILYRRNER